MNEFMCIDLKSFYASVECVLRGLDPLKTALVVADIERGPATICLAATPYIKNMGVSSRCRLFQIPKNINYICAKPRMKKYIEYASLVYKCFLNFFSEEDIYVYSIDESFIFITPYLKLYNATALEIGKMIQEYIFKELKLISSCGIGNNLFLAKVALDIVAKKNISNIGYLSKEIFFEDIWYHEPITDIWSIGRGIKKRLEKYNVYNLHDLALLDLKILEKEFGVIGNDLHEHAWGEDNTSILDIKNYQPKSKSLSRRQVLFVVLDKEKARTVFLEMINDLVIEMIEKRLYCRHFSYSIQFYKEVVPSIHKRMTFENYNASYNIITTSFLESYNLNVSNNPIKKIGISVSDLSTIKSRQLSLFEDLLLKKEEELLNALTKIKNNIGNDKVFRGISYTKESTIKERKKLTGGHNSE